MQLNGFRVAASLAAALVLMAGAPACRSSLEVAEGPDAVASVDISTADASDVASADSSDAGLLAGIERSDRWPACDRAKATQTITFVHVSDLHSSYTHERDDQAESPYARIKGYYRQVQAENPYTIFTDGGDDHEKGSVAEQLSEGYATLDATFAMGFDVRTLGNHDLTWSATELLRFSRDPEAIVLASNLLYLGHDGDFGAEEWAELQVGCLRVGFLGLVAKTFNERNEASPDPPFPGFEARHDYVTRAREILQAHRARVDLVVMVSHLGLATDRGLAMAVPGVDVILGGHSHVITDPYESVGSTVIVHPGAYAQKIARLDLQVSLADRRVTTVTYQLVDNTPRSLPPDADVQAAIDRIMATYAPRALHVVATVAKKQGRAGIAELAAEAVLDLSGADAAIVDLGTVTTGWQPGPLTDQDLLDTFKVEKKPPGGPGLSSFYVGAISGADLERVVGTLAAGWSLNVPAVITPDARYWLALQKHVLFAPERHLPEGVTITDSIPLFEAWRALKDYARTRTGRCLFLDVEKQMPDCQE